MITSEIWEDEFFTSLDIFGRLLWIGLITSCADDQGRLQDNAALIRSKVFPLDDIALTQIDNALNSISEASKIARYTANGKRLIQIIHWWKHQTPRWAGHSAFPAPDGWVDRERFHSTNNEMVEKNWKDKGGYIESCKDSYIAGNTINDVNDDVDVNDDDKEENGEKPSLPAYPIAPEIALYHDVTHLYPGFMDEDKVKQKIRDLRVVMKQPPRDDLKARLEEKYALWKSCRTKDGRLYNPSNPDWLDWCITGYSPAPENGKGKIAPASLSPASWDEFLVKWHDRYEEEPTQADYEKFLRVTSR